MTTAAHSRTGATPEPPSAVASYGHTLGLVGIAIVVAALGALAQARPTTGGSLTSTHASALPAYVSALVIEALLVCYVWAGVRKRGVTLAALSGRISIAVLGQAAVFGLMHAYQGWKAVSEICFLGALFGVVAAWRRSTRPGMIVHAMADILGGWLKGALHFPY